ncbi:MAG: hypothetical protein A6D91_00350 [Bacillaceae bacterium G1]|nr:hypothetical protein [Bacillota bacterium]OJF17489.1 MAG: hypothetical protein A6D91_00350 [Bacillaceae bacterium G1]
MFVNLAFIGMGSVGLLFASRFLSSMNSGIAVTRRPEQAQALLENGLTVRQQDGSSVTRACSAVSLDEWSGDADWGLVFVKQPDLSALLYRLRLKPTQPARFLLFQNGLGHIEQVQAAFPGKPVYVAVTTEGAMRIDDTTVHHTGSGVTWLGPAHDDAGQDETGLAQLERLAADLQAQGMDVRITDRIQQRMWEKWVINCAINPLTGILAVQNGALSQGPPLRDLVLDVAEEAVQVARAHGIRLDEDEMKQKVLDVCEKTAANASSMLQDLLHHRETEIEALNGLLLRLAAQRHVDAPVNRVLYRLLKTVEVLGVRGPVRTWPN